MTEENTISAVKGLIPEPKHTVRRERFSTRRAYVHTFTASAVIRCLGVVSGVLGARLLGPTGRGELAVIIFLPVLLGQLGELELPRSLAFETSRVGEIPRSLIASSFWLGLFLGCLQALILALALPFFLPADKLHLLTPSRWFMLYLPATLVTTTLMGSDQGKGRFGRFSLLLVLPTALYVAAILGALASKSASPQVFAEGMLAAALVTFVVRLWMDWGAVSTAAPEWQIAKRLLRRGVSFYLPTAAGFVLSRADTFILVRLLPTNAVGLYAVAQAIAMGQVGAINPFVQVGFSAVAGETDPRQALETLARHFRVAQLASIAAGILAAAATPWIIRLIFGARFNGAVTTAWLLIGGAALWGMEQVLEQGLRAAGRTRPAMVSNLAGLLILLSTGIPACIHYGIAGLAASSLAAQAINLAILMGFCVFGLKMPLRLFNGLHGESIAQASREAALFVRRFQVR